MCVSAARSSLVYAEQQTGQQNVLRDLNSTCGCATRIDSAHGGIEELLKVKHGYLCCSVVLTFCCVVTAQALPSFRWAPLFARSIARTLMTSAKAACLSACD